MADTKLSDLTALTGAGLAAADEALIVDKSDTTMAASGTDKRMTAEELTSGIQLLGKNMPAGAAGLTGSLASTFDRATLAITGVTLVSGRLHMVRILLPKGLPVTSIAFVSAGTALVTGTNQVFGLFNSSRVQLAITADDTSTAWGTNTVKTLTVTSGPFVTTYAGWYYLGVAVAATTVPNLSGGTTLGSWASNAVPIAAGTSNTGLTNPASWPSTATALTATSNLLYAEVS